MAQKGTKKESSHPTSTALYRPSRPFFVLHPAQVDRFKTAGFKLDEDFIVNQPLPDKFTVRIHRGE